MKTKLTIFSIIRQAGALGTFGALSLFTAFIHIGGIHATAAEPHMYHDLCDPRTPAEDLRQAAHCVTVDARITPVSTSGGETGDRFWMKIDGACEVERKDGSKVTFQGDDSEKHYEITGEAELPVSLKWSFPAGCSLRAHVREPRSATIRVFGTDWKIDGEDLIRYFSLDRERLTADIVVTLHMKSGDVTYF